MSDPIGSPAQLSKRLAGMQENAARLAAAADAPGATEKDWGLAQGAAIAADQYAEYCAAKGISAAAPVPVAAVMAPPPAAAPARVTAPAPQPKPRALSREEAIRTIATAAPFPLPDGMAADAIAEGTAVDAFAVAVGNHCTAERIARRIAEA